ncbi:hypothetical protein BGY98DRAFT_1046675 [Russula aff. rugulosa BPL654]|nr:hypothetical protein BGY98DRAFT_1046675 [Russula aff. rugulosa BPL654]
MSIVSFPFLALCFFLFPCPLLCLYRCHHQESQCLSPWNHPIVVQHDIISIQCVWVHELPPQMEGVFQKFGWKGD